MKIISFVLPCLLVWLVVQPLLSQKHLNRRRLVWQIRRRSIASRRAGRSFLCRQRKGSATIANYRAVKRLMNGHCGDRTIRLVKITAGCCTKITSYVASLPAPAHGSAWCFLLSRAGSAAVFGDVCQPLSFLLVLRQFCKILLAKGCKIDDFAVKGFAQLR